MTMSIQDKLALNKFVVDEQNPHIVMDESRLDSQTRQALLVSCPAGLYTLNNEGRLMFDYAGCLECGTCRVVAAACPGALTWEYPRPTMGVFYRYG